MFFLIMQFLWKYVDDLMGKGLEFSVLLELLFFVSATLIPLALPIAILFSSIMTFGNLAENNELTALKSSGQSLFRIMRPMLIFVILLSVSAFYFTNYILPLANLKSRTIIYNVTEKKPTFGITEGIFYKDIENYSIRVEKKNDNTGELEGILIYQDNAIHGAKTIQAKEGVMLKSENERFLFLKLIDGSMYEPLAPGKFGNHRQPYNKAFFDEVILKFDLSGFDFEEESEELFRHDYEMMSFIQLDVALDSLHCVEDTLMGKFRNGVKEQHLTFNDFFSIDHNAGDTTRIESEFEPVDTIMKIEEMREMELRTAYVSAQSKIRSSKDYIYGQTIYTNAFNNNYKNYLKTWHQRFTLSFAIIVLFFIGAPLGAIIKKGGLGTPLVFATLFFILYYVLTITGENMVESAFIVPWKGMWMATMLLTPLGIFLTYKAANDSALFDLDAYKRIVSKFKRK
ncbi:MAG: LptF/LptG family permease [Crocinitomicaceae bacterium]|nr:LptF/LptG family permease [Crocinitomicaceae bacterium]